MRKLNNYYEKFTKRYENELKKIGDFGDKQFTSNKNSLSFCTDYTLYISDLDFLGYVDVSIEFSKETRKITYHIGKVGVPFYINDCESMKKLVSIFFGSPFSLSIAKIEGLEFARYCVSISECQTEEFSKFKVYVSLLKDYLLNVDRLVIYD